MEKRTRRVISCGFLVYRMHEGEWQILLVRPRADHYAWGIPKGHHEHGETFNETATRETFEETGIIATSIAPLPPSIGAFKNNEIKTLYSFLAVPIDDVEPLADDENVDAAYFSISDLPPVHRYQSSMIAHAINVTRLIEDGNNV